MGKQCYKKKRGDFREEAGRNWEARGGRDGVSLLEWKKADLPKGKPGGTWAFSEKERRS